MTTQINKLKIAVLMGGIGEERDVSIVSGAHVAQALKDAGCNVVTSDIAPDNLDVLTDESIDVFFPALHGEFGEDGRLQQIFEQRGLVYTGSGPEASKLAFDKMASKDAFSKAGIDVPEAIEFDDDTCVEQLENLADKFVVKPIRQGSSVGVSITEDAKEAIALAKKCKAKFGDCMIEEFIDGREITVGILTNQALPIVEVRTQTGFYDYHAKYVDEKTKYLFDTVKNPKLIKKIQDAAINCFNVLGCRDFSRIDFILSKDKVYALEVNTIPGFTSHSLLPKATAKAGYTMSDLCVKIVEAALQRQEVRK